MTKFEPSKMPPVKVEFLMKQGYTRRQAREFIKFEQKGKFWLNDLYQVGVYDENEDFLWLSIKRRDKEVIHDWRHLQIIKNEIVGEEHEGFELYPAESRLVDTANQYHLWVFKNPEHRMPIGFNQGRHVSEDIHPSGKQRKFD